MKPGHDGCVRPQGNAARVGATGGRAARHGGASRPTRPVPHTAPFRAACPRGRRSCTSGRPFINLTYTWGTSRMALAAWLALQARVAVVAVPSGLAGSGGAVLENRRHGTPRCRPASLARLLGP